MTSAKQTLVTNLALQQIKELMQMMNMTTYMIDM